jgi:trehalose-6-phosphate synthase
MAPPPSLIIVSNRLPITIKKLKTGSYECSQSTGGLAGALGGLAKSMPFRWFGWPGLEIPQEDEELVRQKTVDYDVLPIFLDNDLANKYYNGFSSKFPHPYTVHLRIDPQVEYWATTKATRVLTLTTCAKIPLCGHCFITSCMKWAALTRLTGMLTLRLTSSSPK